ncbi:MAG: hypothetical protein QGG42_19950 [Phycisphaerae bacterium]|jgi:hypothetical protein|nr:hypothetical protein [Phycisphaerae bacterium]
MKGVVVVLGLAIVLGFAGFYGGGYTCRFIQELRPGALRRRPLAEIISDSGDRGVWALTGGAIGVGAGAILGIVIISSLDRRKKRFARLAQEAQSEADGPQG